jgi:hypothetical protein
MGLSTKIFAELADALTVIGELGLQPETGTPLAVEAMTRGGKVQNALCRHT